MNPGAYPVTSLSARTGLSIGAEIVGDLLRDSRRRLYQTLIGIPHSAWSTSTRRCGWTIHDAAQHLVRSAELHSTFLRGRDVCRLDPDNRVSGTASTSRTPEQTLSALKRAVQAETKAFALRLFDESRSEVVTTPTGRLTHWSLLTMATFRDAWIHERDILIALDLAGRPRIAETRLACLYSLLNFVDSNVGPERTFQAVVSFRGAPDPAYEILSHPADILITTGASKSVDVWGDVTAVLDSLAGRETELSSTLSRRPEWSRSRSSTALEHRRNIIR